MQAQSEADPGKRYTHSRTEEKGLMDDMRAEIISSCASDMEYRDAGPRMNEKEKEISGSSPVPRLWQHDQLLYVSATTSDSCHCNGSAMLGSAFKQCENKTFFP